MSTPENQSLWRGRASFAATRWSVVLAAADGKAGSRSRRALEELAGIYWPSLYAFIRRQGAAPEEAEDLTQEFFARLLEKGWLSVVDPAKGKFRSFLLAALKHFLANQRDLARAKKRGGGRRALSLDVPGAEAFYQREPTDRMTPERLFERRWALAMLDEVLARLRREYRRRGREAIFDALKCTLTADADAPPQAQIAHSLRMSETAVRIAAHRLRKRYREVLRDEIAQTVAAPDLVDDEIRYLLKCL